MNADEAETGFGVGQQHWQRNNWHLDIGWYLYVWLFDYASGNLTVLERLGVMVLVGACVCSGHTAAPATPLGRLRSWLCCHPGKKPSRAQLCASARSVPVTAAIRLPPGSTAFSSEAGQLEVAHEPEGVGKLEEMGSERLAEGPVQRAGSASAGRPAAQRGQVGRRGRGWALVP